MLTHLGFNIDFQYFCYIYARNDLETLNTSEERFSETPVLFLSKSWSQK